VGSTRFDQINVVVADPRATDPRAVHDLRAAPLSVAEFI
jgi:hypothetical protein